MGISTNCCLNISSPPPLPTPSSLRKTTQVTWPKKERSLKGQCVMGVACLIIGLEMDNSIGRGSGIAIADQNMHQIAQSNEKGSRWSDKRACPPWQVNSLETIVPENLPRPAARRRWEGVGFTRTAPAVKVVVVRSSKGSCFTM
ncbi:hypothetical protein RHMOL_Rhmol02G0237400 [Rhododendron molle]|uniref:Uncharacterized protein n=1 Tax=Rhododendron molle TaxID=49168 RepID=A0ACC0PWI2_RHOML|nr:hypothetical protein RHMOL_Rhmol02G0237400 [Rhododendron molle]